jgi:uncharacterized membrane protein YedE/YeeE
MKTTIAVLITGMIFGIGLSWSHMINPNKVQDFLDITGHFDPSLLFVMLGALPVAFFGFKLVLKKPAPLLAEQFQLPDNPLIDKPLLIGAVIFGIGWGMSGYCPGPAVTGLGIFSFESVLMVVSIFCGLFAYKWLFARQ